MKQKTYKCPECGATGVELIYDIFIIKQRRVYNNLLLHKSRTVDEDPDEYDKKYPIWTKCSACDAVLFGEAKDYIIEGDND